MTEDRIYIEGTEALKPGAALAIFERLMGRPATPAEIAELSDDTEEEGE